MTLKVRPLTPADRAHWDPLWAGYRAFYHATIPDETTDLSWARFHDDAEPMWAFGAFDGERMVGIVHMLAHRSTWTNGDYIYLQDLFTDETQRGKGVGRALIERVYDEARKMGAARVYWLTHETNARAILLYDRIADRSGFIQYRKIL